MDDVCGDHALKGRLRITRLGLYGLVTASIPSKRIKYTQRSHELAVMPRRARGTPTVK